MVLMYLKHPRNFVTASLLPSLCSTWSSTVSSRPVTSLAPPQPSSLALAMGNLGSNCNKAYPSSCHDIFCNRLHSQYVDLSCSFDGSWSTSAASFFPTCIRESRRGRRSYGRTKFPGILCHYDCALCDVFDAVYTSG